MNGPRTDFPPTQRVSTETVGGRYRLGAGIGRGGAADVYEGVDVRLGRPVAVKIFRVGADPEMERRFAEEAVLLARLQHPGLVTVYDAGRHQGSAYLVMELVTGQTLRQCLGSEPMSPRRVAELGAGLGRALAHVHGAGIVHRDIKPSNVLLDASGAPHLADFGIARLVNATRHTASDVLIGTAAYLAPEQVMGREVGPAADIYALGLVLLECLKGELEYVGTPLEAAVARVHRSPVVPGSVPPELARLLHAMTAQDEATRPDAPSCARALSALCAAPPPAALSSVAPVTLSARADDETRSRARASHTGRTGHARRLVVGTALTALSAALGATLAVTLDTGAHSDERVGSSSPASELDQPPSDSARPPGTAAADPDTRRPGSASASGPSRSTTAATTGDTAPAGGTAVPEAAAPAAARRTPPGAEKGGAAPQHHAPGRDKKAAKSAPAHAGPGGARKPAGPSGGSPDTPGRKNHG
ncbi:serine/threonine protein kinase [Streptomyces sp. BK022]|uniref:serine/threonine-protein kinase n=1 Tax=Streptomyces sp. BK022 TaxID=2512123 RepID=UPI0010E32B60|nr:serine/threonine-protein kinase [Streptomyces sp. BK022]RZU36633.1 serine/threonine protein kinase [Streptomyces sp. BK022]